MSAFSPCEIIFCPTSMCNLACSHCFTQKTSDKLDIDLCKIFLKNTKEHIQNIGFSGGEPFLNLPFMKEIIKTARSYNFVFDRIMTGASFFENEKDLTMQLESLFEAGYDGTFGVSFDSFHGQKLWTIATFIKIASRVFMNNSIVTMTSVISPKKSEQHSFEKDLKMLASMLECKLYKEGNLFIIEGNNYLVRGQFIKQCLPCNIAKNTKCDKWFDTDDYCQSPGNVLYVHATGKVAVCCGFANENEALCIGTIHDNFDTLMHNASCNKMIKACYETGLGTIRKLLERQGKIEFITDDICTFCDWLCYHLQLL